MVSGSPGSLCAAAPKTKRSAAAPPIRTSPPLLAWPRPSGPGPPSRSFPRRARGADPRRRGPAGACPSRSPSRRSPSSVPTAVSLTTQLERADVGIGIARGRARLAALVGGDGSDAFAPPSAGFVAASSRATVSVGPLAASTPPATPVPAIGAVAANTDWAAMFSRSPAMLPLTSLPNRLWPLLSVTAPLMSE